MLCLMANAAIAANDTADYDRYGAEIGKLTAAARYEEALSLAEKFQNVARQKSDAESLYYARATTWKAYLNLTLGRQDISAPLFEEALAILEKTLKPDDPELATGISNLGISYQSASRLEDAEALFKKALAIRERVLPPDHPHIADSLNNLAGNYKMQDRLAEAELLQRRALAVREKAFPANSPAIAESLQNLASSLELEGHNSEAEALLKKAIGIRKASQPPLHPEIAGAIHHLAHNLVRQQHFAEAEAQFKAALRIRGQSQPQGHPDVARNCQNLAVLYIDEERDEEALPLLKRSVAMFEKTYAPNHRSLIEPIELMAFIASRSGRDLEALNYARRGTQISAEREKLTRNTSAYLQDHVRLAWKVYEAGHLKDQSLLEEALIVAQRAGLTATAASISNLSVRLAASDPHLREIIRERQDLENARETSDREFAALLAIPAADRVKAERKVRAALNGIESRLNAIDAQIKVEFPKYAELIRPAPLTLDQIRAYLKPDEALVNFLTTGTETFVWAITSEQAAWRRLDITQPDIEAYERTLRDALRVRKLTSENQLYSLNTAHHVYKRLFGSIEDVIKTKRQLIAVSNGALTSMPFHALVLTPPANQAMDSMQSYRDADWFIRRHALSVLPAVSSLQALRSQKQTRETRRPLIGFANPKYGDQRIAEAATRTLTRAYTAYWKGASVNLEALRAGLIALPESEQELRSVAKSVGAADEDLKFGAEASEAAVKQAKLENYRIVYFAAHGLVAGELSGLGEPALALALPQVATETDDGLLTMSEVSKLKLDADWVVLSACNTAAADKQGADALSGLARAFFHAGARALLVSHWPVGTDAAVRLTTATFEALRQNPGMGRAEALRQAMLALMADPNEPLNAYPAYWAPFFVVGDGAGR